MVTVMLFQFTPLREGRRCPAARSTSAPIFQFTPLREGRRSALIGTSFGWMISIHAPPRGATRSLYRALALSAYFNSRPSARGDKHLKNFFCVLSYFNSRPSARGDQTYIGYAWYEGISIHAPPRGATSRQKAITGSFIFQFTPLREGRRCWKGASASADSFQFTPLREGRRHHIGLQAPCACISIHAPPRGATHKVSVLCASILFQFTPLREGRLRKIDYIIHTLKISIHAPPRGATASSVSDINRKLISIHAPPRGATSHGFFVTIPSPISIHAPPRGATVP